MNDTKPKELMSRAIVLHYTFVFLIQEKLLANLYEVTIKIYKLIIERGRHPYKISPWTV